MAEKRVSLYERLPEIYRIRDTEQLPPDQLKHYLGLVETVFGEIHTNIEALYHDLFIETCDPWVIPYLGDLLGTSHLKGDPWTLRADVADTIALRRRKGTLGAIALLTYTLTRWGVHAVELRENLVWNQALNHQRPDAGGEPPHGLLSATRFTPVRGGTVPVRDPAMLSLLQSPFDPFGHTIDVKPPSLGGLRYNLPNLAIFLWRLVAYRVVVSQPLIRNVVDQSAIATDNQAIFVVRLDVHPRGEPVRLFNTSRFDPDQQPPVVSQLDATPGPIPTARLTAQSEAGAPEQYVAIETYDPASLSDPDLPPIDPVDLAQVGLQLHLPVDTFADQVWPPSPGTPTDQPPAWTIRGDNLCGWEVGLLRSLQNREVSIDPVIGRMVIGVETEAEAQAIADQLRLTYTYGAVGPVGAHPISRVPAPQTWLDDPVERRFVNFHAAAAGLQTALSGLETASHPVVIEIGDSMTHTLDLGAISDLITEDGGPNLSLNHSLILRAASGQRPIIQLTQPLRFRPAQVVAADPAEQDALDAALGRLTVRLEGLYLTRAAGFPADAPLIARAALHSLELLDCTLDPGGIQPLQGDRTPIHTALRLANGYGFAADSPQDEAFRQTPEIHLQRTLSGPLQIDTGYRLFLTESILDGGEPDSLAGNFAVWGFDSSPEEALEPPFEETSELVLEAGWGPPTTVQAITVFGQMRVESIHGQGGIWVQTLEVLNNQTGCLKFSYFSGQGDRLPQNHGCVTGDSARLRFTQMALGQPAYGQLAATTDFRIRERGPNDDAMGAFGFLLEAHKWRNLHIRYREFMPVGTRPLLIPVT